MLHLTRNLKSLALLALVAACGGSPPAIENTTVTPSNWQISGVNDQATFTINTNVLHLGGVVTSVTAQVEGQSPIFNLQKKADIVGGESWTVSTNFTLWSGISNGTYFINVTATNDSGATVTQAHAAMVTITD